MAAKKPGKKLRRIYTRGGDKGATGTRGAGRVSKADCLVAALGDLDELNCQIGLLAARLDGAGQQGHEGPLPLKDLQRLLLVLGAEVAAGGAGGKAAGSVRSEMRVAHADVKALENAIDRFNAGVEPLTSFVLPGGSEPAALAHVARAVCRRAERSLVAGGKAMAADSLAWINRLSDYLFTLALYLNRHASIAELLWP